MSITSVEGSNIRRFERPVRSPARAHETRAVPAGGATVVELSGYVRARQARQEGVPSGEERPPQVADAAASAEVQRQATTGAVATLGAAIRGDRFAAAAAQAGLLAEPVVGVLVG
ncbi:MAG: hypothetical protein Q8L86_04545 [Vicinamibacterales bacterium]|nr:hypothetical protein [Vicinamibacterales bacterium]